MQQYAMSYEAPFYNHLTEFRFRDVSWPQCKADEEVKPGDSASATGDVAQIWVNGDNETTRQRLS